MAVTVLNLCPDEIDICISRGDDTPMAFRMQEAGVDLTIAGFTYLLSVDTREEPDDVATQLFQLTGVEVSPLVTFSPTTSNTDLTPDDYFFDIQETNTAGKLRTVAKGKFTVSQDITK